PRLPHGSEFSSAPPKNSNQRASSKRPAPLEHVRFVDSKFVCVLSTSDLQISKLFFCMCACRSEVRYAINHINSQCVTIDFIVDSQFHRRIDIASLFVTANVDIFVVGPVIGEFVNQPWIAMEVEDDRLIVSKQAIKVSITRPVRMLGVFLQLK